MASEEDIDKQILKKYEIQTKLGKGAYGVGDERELAGCALTEVKNQAQTRALGNPEHLCK
eukprot:1159911-Pelagomonas_calceolata.AAC.8